ncbi:MAG: hypothetical protein PHT12_06210 [Patescibacteria group bacterium]|nr:hypothetical protein [Patescibacteria group bacterium]
MRYERTPEFERDLKNLLKRFATLEEDLLVAQKNAIELRWGLSPRTGTVPQGIDNGAIFEIPGFCTSDRRVCKLKKFACRALKGHGVMSGIRVIFAYFPAESRVVYLEMYFKGDKENEDRGRVRGWMESGRS